MKLLHVAGRPVTWPQIGYSATNERRPRDWPPYLAFIRRALSLTVPFATILCQPPAAYAQPLPPEVLHEFQLAPRNPLSKLVEDNEGSFYGTTEADGCGDVFKISRNGQMSVLASFNPLNLTNPCSPFGPLVFGTDGSLYGTTRQGGENHHGVAFRLTTAGKLNPLVSFGGTNGIGPNGLTLAADGNFYGTTWSGGPANNGTVFRLTSDGQLSTLVAFTGPNGSGPVSELTTGADGSLYGTTREGGQNNTGTIFKVSTNGAFATLVAFDNTHGADPFTALALGNDGNLYGATLSGDGTLFRVTPSGLLTTLVAFNGTNGAYPIGPLVLANDGNLYGETRYGGSNNSGTLFRLGTTGEFKTLVSFDANAPTVDTQNALSLGHDGKLYGTTQNGGQSGWGTIFSVTTNGDLATLFEFGDPQGEVPNGLAIGGDGSLYGTTASGGSQGAGTLFKLDTNLVFSSLASVVGTQEAPWPVRLIVDALGNFYGASGASALFKMEPNGYLTSLAFSDTNKTQVVSSLIVGGDNTLYGTTYFLGYAYAYGGIVFKFSPEGELTTLVTFNGANGDFPRALAFGKDGNLYGLTEGAMGDGVYQGTGTVFKVTTTGVLTTLASFPWTITNPAAGVSAILTLGNDGAFHGSAGFYGQTSARVDAGNDGYVFRLTSNGMTVLSLLLTNGGNSWVDTPLTQGRDGVFYGTTGRGGNSDLGTVFEIGPGSKLTTLASFNGINGAYPSSSLIYGNDGNLYGATQQGGSGGGGTLFRIVLPKLNTPGRAPDGSLQLTGVGAGNQSYSLWASPDLTLPLESWSLLIKGSFDNSGNLSFRPRQANAKQFYRLSVP